MVDYTLMFVNKLTCAYFVVRSYSHRTCLQRPGTCFHCGEGGHWARECPHNPLAKDSAALAGPLPTDPALLVRQQRADSYKAIEGGLTPLLRVSRSSLCSCF